MSAILIVGVLFIAFLVYCACARSSQLSEIEEKQEWENQNK